MFLAIHGDKVGLLFSSRSQRGYFESTPSSNRCATFVEFMPKALHTSTRQNIGSSLAVITTRNSPNSEELNN